MDNEKFKYFRRNCGLTQEEAAEVMDTSVFILRKYEQGTRKIPMEHWKVFVSAAKNRLKKTLTDIEVEIEKIQKIEEIQNS